MRHQKSIHAAWNCQKTLKISHGVALKPVFRPISVTSARLVKEHSDAHNDGKNKNVEKHRECKFAGLCRSFVRQYTVCVYRREHHKC